MPKFTQNCPKPDRSNSTQIHIITQKNPNILPPFLVINWKNKRIKRIKSTIDSVLNNSWSQLPNSVSKWNFKYKFTWNSPGTYTRARVRCSFYECWQSMVVCLPKLTMEASSHWKWTVYEAPTPSFFASFFFLKDCSYNFISTHFIISITLCIFLVPRVLGFAIQKKSADELKKTRYPVE